MEIDGDVIRFRFPMRSELMGHPERRVLHGGVISSCLDVAGGMSAFLGVLRQYDEVDNVTLEAILSRLATIDMRVDYLRPGQGEEFTATGAIVRAGKKVAVTRMTLTNERRVELAIGTATYIVG